MSVKFRPNSVPTLSEARAAVPVFEDKRPFWLAEVVETLFDEKMIDIVKFVNDMNDWSKDIVDGERVEHLKLQKLNMEFNAAKRVLENLEETESQIGRRSNDNLVNELKEYISYIQKYAEKMFVCAYIAKRDTDQMD